MRIRDKAAGSGALVSKFYIHSLWILCSQLCVTPQSFCIFSPISSYFSFCFKLLKMFIYFISHVVCSLLSLNICIIL